MAFRAINPAPASDSSGGFRPLQAVDMDLPKPIITPKKRSLFEPFGGAPTDLGKPVAKPSEGFAYVGGAIKKVVGGAVDALSDTGFMKAAAAQMLKIEAAHPVARKIFDIPTNIGAGLTNKPEEAVPFAGEIYQIGQLTRLKQISDKANAGTMTPEEQKWATDYLKAHDEEQRRMAEDWGYAPGNIAKQSIQFGLEILGASFAAPESGGGSIAGLVAERGALKAAQEVATKIFTDAAARKIFSMEIGKWVAESGTRMGVASATRIPQGTVDRMLGTPIVNDQGDFTGLANDGQPLGQAAINSASSAFVEYSSEFTGGGINKALAMVSAPVRDVLLKSAMIKAVLKANPGISPSAFRQVIEKAGWHGIVGEWGEERVGDAMYATLHAAGLSDQTFSISWKSVLDELGGFAFMGTVVNATDKALNHKTIAADTTPDALDQSVADAKQQLADGATPAEVTMGLSKEMSAKAAQAVVAQASIEHLQESLNPETKVQETPVEKVPETKVQKKETAPVEAKAAGDAIEQLKAISDESALTKKAGDLQDVVLEAASTFEASTKEIKDSIASLEDKVDAAAPRSQAKKDAKVALEKARTQLRTQEKAFEDAQMEHAVGLNDLILNHLKENFDVSGLSEDTIGELKDEILIQATDGIETTHDMTIAQIADNVMKEAGHAKGKTEPKPKELRKIGGLVGKEMKGKPVTVRSHNLRFVLEVHDVPLKEAVIGDKKMTLPMMFDTKEEALAWAKKNGNPIQGESTEKKTQKEAVKEVVQKKGKASIKEIAAETKILEPNVRRILGVGAKDGEFERIADGVYTIKVGEKEIAWVIPGDALETLPKLAEGGFKADMVFLDIPYAAAGNQGGNRMNEKKNTLFETITPDQFGEKIVDSVSKILRTPESPVVYMFSQSKTSEKTMQPYTQKLIDAGYKPIAKGDYYKMSKKGTRLTMPMRSDALPPEGIIIFNRTGEYDFKTEPNLQFKLVRPKGYQTEKPAEMLKALIEMTTKEGDTVLDPFAGSGVTGEQATKTGRKSVSIEKKPGQAEEIAKRIEAAVPDLPEKVKAALADGVEEFTFGQYGANASDTFYLSATMNDGTQRPYLQDLEMDISEAMKYTEHLNSLLDNDTKAGEDKGNEQATDNSGSGDNTGAVSEPLPQGGEEPGGSSGATKSTGGGNGRGERGGESRKRSSARLNNDEIQKIVEGVTAIDTNGVVSISGQITEDVLEAANQYKPGGESKEGRGILDEYYTAPRVVDMVKSLIDTESKVLKILEPSAGAGNFLYAIPDMAVHEIHALEINPLTARIAKIFHQDANVSTKPFESMFMDERGNKVAFTRDYDLVLGNPPYGEHRGMYLGLGEEKEITRYEDYFIKRSLDLLKKDGKLAMVVPSSFLRSMESKTKIGISAIGVLESAYRLPEGVFGGTQVGTDIIIMHRRDQANEMTDLVSLVSDNYFKENPSNILGVEKKRKNRFGKMESYVSGTLDEAIALFEQYKNDAKAKEILKEEGVAATPENIEATSDSIEEAGEQGAKDLTEEVKKQTEKGKKTIEKKIVEKVKDKSDKTAPLADQYAEIPKDEIELWKKTTPEGWVENPTVAEAKSLNYMGGRHYLDFNYLQGDIYEKLSQLEKDKTSIPAAQYKAQKEKLETVLPKRETLDDIRISPNIGFAKTVELGTVAGSEDPKTLQSGFLNWAKDLPREAFGDSSYYEVRSYVNDEQVRGSDKDRNELERIRRKEAADNLFTKYLKDGLDEEEQETVKDAYNRTFNFFHVPDYANVPMFSDIYTTFDGGKFKLKDTQKRGIGRLVNKGVGILAHEVGFGKTISGTLATNEIMERGWAKRPLIIVPNVNIEKQWVRTMQELIPGVKINRLGNLGASFKGDLSSLKIPEGAFSIMTYEGLKRLSFKDETYTALSGKFGYISDDLEKHKSTRDIEKQKTEFAKSAGTMKKGTRSDLFFEDLGFDLLTFDEMHNANHIVSKVKLKKGQASEFNRFALRPSDLGIKTWLASQYIQQQNQGRNVIGLTATPFTNHPLEYYSILSLVADKSLEKMGLQNANDFFGTFMEASNESEFKADGSFQPKTDIRGFRNYRQFRTLLDTYIDFKDIDDSIQRPNRVQRTYEIPQNELGLEMEAKAQLIFEEDEKETGKGAKVLRAIGELRKIAFSPFASNFSNPLPKDQYKMFVEDSPKIKLLMGLLKQNKKDKPEAGQLVYSEVGVDYLPHMKEYLVKVVGYKDTEVEIISGATPKEKRPEIQDAYNAGKIKVILGSSAIKEGMNLQTNTTDLYILSMPWNFTQMRQVIGRAWRQGNDWANVRINNLFIQDSVDIFLSQKLDNKQRRYEAAIKSGDQDVDVGDVAYDELKFELIKNPITRAKLEIGQAKKELEHRISQETAELAFATRKLEKVSELASTIARTTKDLAEREDDMKKAVERGEKDLSALQYWVDREKQSLARQEKEQSEQLAKLKERGIETSVLLRKQEEGRKKIADMETEAAELNLTFDDRVAQLAASIAPRRAYSPEIVDELVKQRAEDNKTFYTKKQAPVEETVSVETHTVKQTGKKVVKTTVSNKKSSKSAPKSAKSTPTRDDEVLAVLTDKSLSADQIVDKLLNVRQEGKEFKDTGARVAGSKKERAVMSAILEHGTNDTVAELIKRFGAEAVAENMQKDEILEGAVKPDAEADKKAQIPAFITGWKVDVLNSITRTPILEYKSGRYSHMQTVSVDFVQQYLTEYPDLLRKFVKELANVKTVEQTEAFRDKYRWNFAELTSSMGGEPTETNVGIETLGRAMKSKMSSVREGISRVRNLLEKEEILKEGSKKWENEDRWDGLTGWGGTASFDTKKEAEAETKENHDDAKENIETERKRLFEDYEYWLPKSKKGTQEQTELRHGNFKPMEHIVRTEPAVAEEELNVETLTKKLGFKSVQFGNYMDDAFSREHTRHTVGAVYDMTKALKIDFPKLINTMGLSLAYGARGGGGFAVAHYEPTHNIINMTKNRGDGSFFHEFVHFMDWTTNKNGNRGSWRSAKDRFYRGTIDEASYYLLADLTGSVSRRKAKYTPAEEVDLSDNDFTMRGFKEGKSFEDALRSAEQTYAGERTWQEGERYQAIADVYRKEFEHEAWVWRKDTEFFNHAKSYGGHYWAENHELIARAGQAYIEDKLAEQGMRNDYLTRPTKAAGNEFSESLAKTYPQGEERARFNKSFDKVFDELRKKYPLAPQHEVELDTRFKIANLGVNDLVLITDRETGQTAERMITKVREDGSFSMVTPGFGIPYRATPERFEIKLLKRGDHNAPIPKTGITFGEMWAQEAKEGRFKGSSEAPVATWTDAGVYINDVKHRLKLDFDVYYAETILGGYSKNLITGLKTAIEAEGAMFDNSITLSKIMTRFAPNHEVGHLVFANLDRIPVFHKEGFTKEVLLAAQAQKMGLPNTEQNARAIEEQIMLDYEAWLEKRQETESPSLLQRFFIFMKKLWADFLRAVHATEGSILEDFYEVLTEGKAVQSEMVQLENSGVMREFIDDSGALDVEGMEDAKLKIKETDGRLTNIIKTLEDVNVEQRQTEGALVQWRKDLEAAIEVKKAAEVEAQATDIQIKELAQFTFKSTKADHHVGNFTTHGQAVAANLGDVDELQKQVHDYLLRKIELNEARKLTKEIRDRIKNAKNLTKENKGEIKTLIRRIKQRQIRIEQIKSDVAKGMELGKKIEHERLTGSRRNIYLDAMRKQIEAHREKTFAPSPNDDQSFSAIKKDINIVTQTTAQASDFYKQDPVEFRAAGIFLDVANDRRERKAGIDSDFSQILKPYFELKEKGLVNSTLMRGDKLGKELTNDELASMGLKGAEVDAYKAVRAGFAKSSEMLIKQMRDHGYPEKTVERYQKVLEGYMPHRWIGRFAVKEQRRITSVNDAQKHFIETDDNGQMWITEEMDSFKTKREAILSFEKKRRENPNKTDFRFKLDTLDSVDVDFFSEQNLSLKNMQSAIEHAKAPEEVKRLMEDAIDDMSREKGFGRSYIHRTGVRGYEEAEVPKIIAQHFVGFSGYITKMQAAPLYFEALKQADPRRQKDFYRWLRGAISYDMSSTKEFDFGKKIAFIYMLANDLSFLITNATQNFIVGTGELGKIDAATPEIEIIKAMTDWATGNLTEEERKETARLLEVGRLGGEMTSELMGFMNNPLYRSIGGGFNKAMYWSTAFVEQNVNRVPAFLAARRMLAKHKKMTGTALNKAALEVSDDIHFRYGKQHRPEYQRGRKGILFVFTHYIRSLLYLMARNLKDREYAAFTRMLAYTFLFGGAQALPFAKLFFAIYHWIFGAAAGGDGDQPAWYIALLKGLPATVGIDMSGRVGIGIFTLESIATDPQNITKYLGSIGGLGERLYSVVGLTQQHRYTEALAKITPDMVGNFFKAYYGYEIGVRSKYGNFLETSEGEPMKYTAWEAIIRGIGFSPTRESLAWEAKAAEFAQTDAESAARSIAKRQIQEAVLNGNDDEALKLEAQAKADGTIKSDYVYDFKKDAIVKEGIESGADVSDVIAQLDDFRDLSPAMVGSIKRDYKIYQEFGMKDERVKELEGTQTNGEKVVLLQQYKEEMGEATFDEWFSRARASGLVSKALYKDFSRAQ